MPEDVVTSRHEEPAEKRNTGALLVRVDFPEGSMCPDSICSGPKYPYRDYFKVKVRTIWIHGR